MRIKNGLVVGVILLFIGVAVQPGIAIVQPEDINKEYIEVTTEIFGIPGQNNTVKLTIEEAEEIEVFYDSIRERLNKTKTREEAEGIFKDAVIELHKFGLLGRLSVKQAHKLVTRGHWNSRNMKFLENIYSIPENNSDEMDNKFCLLIGNTNMRVTSQGPLARISSVLYDAVYNLWFSTRLYKLFKYLSESEYHILYDILLILFTPIALILLLVTFARLYSTVIWEIYDFFPLNIGSIVGFGYNRTKLYNGESEVYPAEGWIHTIGLKGMKNWSGEFYGRLPLPLIYYWKGSVDEIYYPGISGFIGIKQSYRPSDNASSKCFLIGSAYSVKIGSEPIWD